MREEQALMTAIRNNPEDDLSRLAYADWLEERADPRAEYLRLLCELPNFARGTAPCLTLLRRLAKLGEEVEADWELALCRPHAVVLEAYEPDRKAEVVKEVRQVTGFWLTDAILLVGGHKSLQPRRSLPRVIAQGLSEEDAERVCKQLIAVGATARTIAPISRQEVLVGPMSLERLTSSARARRAAPSQPA